MIRKTPTARALRLARTGAESLGAESLFFSFLALVLQGGEFDLGAVEIDPGDGLEVGAIEETLLVNGHVLAAFGDGCKCEGDFVVEEMDFLRANLVVAAEKRDALDGPRSLPP